MGKAVALFTSAIVFVVLMIVQGVIAIDFSRHVDGHLQRAANANQIGLARTELQTAINYLEQNNMTTGYTSVLYRTPDEDIGYWYQNLKEAIKDLDTVEETASPLERSNVLIKLRETITDEDHVIVPNGISRYPNNTTWAFFSLLSLAIAGVCLLAIEFD